MFGITKGSCGLAPGDRTSWMGHICGLCGALSATAGTMARLATNPDAALLSALCAAQLPAGPEMQPNRCPLRRGRRLFVVSPSDPGARFAASVSLLMAAVTVRDHAADREGLLRRAPRLGRRLTDHWCRLGEATGRSVGFDASSLLARADAQQHIEARAPSTFLAYCRPTEIAVASAFAHTAVLASRPANAPHLHEMGRTFGRLMVLLDSYEDRATDAARRKLNFLSATVPVQRIDREASALFCEGLRELRRNLGQLDLPRPELVDKLFGPVLYHSGRRILAPALAVADAGGPGRPLNEDYWGRPGDRIVAQPERGRRDPWSDEDYWGRPEDLPPGLRPRGRGSPDSTEDTHGRDIWLDVCCHGHGGGSCPGDCCCDSDGDCCCDGDGDCCCCDGCGADGGCCDADCCDCCGGIDCSRV